MVWGLCLILTSIYGLLAFLPYTYFALIKSPAYAWMPWFAEHQGILYLTALLGVAFTAWPTRNSAYFPLFGSLAGLGAYLVLRPFMPSLQDNWTAYRWSLIILLPLAATSGMDAIRHWPARGLRKTGNSQFPYSTVVVIAVFVSLISVSGTALRTYAETRALVFSWAGLELTTWTVISHLLLAIMVFSVLNIILIIAGRTSRPSGSAVAGICGLTLISLSLVLLRFLNSAFSFSGWAATFYAASLAAAITLWVTSLVLPSLHWHEVARGRHPLAAWIVSGAASLLAIILPTVIGGSDWNGVLLSAFTLLLWIALSVCLCILRPARAGYSAAAILAVVLLSGFAYKALQATVIFWAKPLGATDDEVSRNMEDYAARNTSFQLAHHILGNAREDPCGDYCSILREYTNIRDAQVKTDLQLVDRLTPSSGARPNIFFFVIDSLRPDYLGAYNPQVDFTPHLDSFARDSVVLHNVYTQYAGTSLSEPAIWAGALLLHAHYMQPFARVNSLEKLAHTDNYRMLVSDDEVLSQLLAPADDLVKLDADKKLWNHLEVCSTLQQAKVVLDHGSANQQPWLFYTQPKNVHQFAHNDLPRMNSQNWRQRPGFNNRIAYEVHQVDECLGGFFAYLKAKGIYDNSIIILASDHGDATGEFGRWSHSLSIWPEVIRVPLIVHLPAQISKSMVYDDSHLSALTDITPSLYYLLGHRPIISNPLFGHPLFAAREDELAKYQRNELFLASDERAVYGLLTDNGRFLYTTYDSPARSFLFDLSRDPNAEHNLLTDALKQRYDERIIDHLHAVADFYGYSPGVGSLLAAR